MNKKNKILFLCTGNSCRSQMAEAWAKKLMADVLEVYSAGVEKHGLNPLAVKVMAEAGIDINEHKSKLIEELDCKDFDYVISLCSHAHETCPVFPGPTKKIHRPFDDPPRLARNAQNEEEALKYYRKVRDEIKQFILELPESLEL
ncbi:arsenate reductase ArsC [Desulfovulcanus sp.]